MNTILALLVLLSLGLLIIGLFSPKRSLFWDKKNEGTKKRSFIIYGVIFLASFIMFGITTDNQKDIDSHENLQTEIFTEEPERELTQDQLDSIAKTKRIAIYEERKSQTVSAPNLLYSYKANEVSADNSFKDKRFYVEGVVNDIKKDLFGEIYVTLKTGEIFEHIQCYISDSDKVSTLRKGQRITVFGTCNGLMINVLMKNCELADNLNSLKE